MTTIYATEDNYEGIPKEIFDHKQTCINCGDTFFVAYIEIKPDKEITFNNHNSFCPFCGKNPRNKTLR